MHGGLHLKNEIPNLKSKIPRKAKTQRRKSKTTAVSVIEISDFLGILDLGFGIYFWYSGSVPFSSWSMVRKQHVE
jgi:hypothetical protein